MEVFSCKINQSHYCIWKENESCIIEDVEANKTPSLTNDQLRWTQNAIVELLNSPVERFFQMLAGIVTESNWYEFTSYLLNIERDRSTITI